MKGGEAIRTTESIRTGLKDARVVKGLVGDKVAAMMMTTMTVMMTMKAIMMMISNAGVNGWSGDQCKERQ